MKCTIRQEQVKMQKSPFWQESISCKKASDDLVVVTNEVFSDSMTDNPEMEKYLKLLGNINLRMGEMADLVTEVVYGIPVERKDIKK